MRVVEVRTGVSGYPALLAHVLKHGEPRTARGRETLDAGPTTVVMHDLSAPLPLGTGRNLSRAIAAAEALQLVGGFDAPELLTPAFDALREPDGSFWAGYGRRIGDQIWDQLRKLRADVGTRQSVVTLWDPDLDNQPGKLDYPCTVALMFWLEHDRLQALTVMRSQDVWLGTPYDWFQQVTLQHTVARALGVGVGLYRHVTTSTHLYADDVERARALVDRWYGLTDSPADRSPRERQPRGLGVEGGGWQQTRNRCVLLRAGTLEHPTADEAWFAQHLRRRDDPAPTSPETETPLVP